MEEIDAPAASVSTPSRRPRLHAQVRSRLTFANVTAVIALVAALSSTAWAVATITGSQIQDDTITSADIRNGTLRAGDLRSGVLPTYTAGNGLALSSRKFSAQGSPYARVVAVARSGGDFTSISAALASITDATDSKRYLVYVAPGIYDERITMKANIDIEGAGTRLTIINAGSAASLADAAVVTAVDDAVISDLGIHSDGTGDGSYSVGVHALGQSAIELRDVAIVAGNSSRSGVNVHGVVFNGSDGTLTRVNVTGTGGNLGVKAVLAVSGSTLSFIDSKIAGDAHDCRGVELADASNLSLDRSTVRCHGDYWVAAINAPEGSDVTITRSHVTGSNLPSTSTAYGMVGVGSTFNISGSRVEGLSAFNGIGVGLFASSGDPSTFNVDSSVVVGTSSAGFSDAFNSAFHFGGTKLDAPSGVGYMAPGEPTTVTCVSSWTGEYLATDSTCGFPPT